MTKVNPTGSALVFSTLLGGRADEAGLAFVTGTGTVPGGSSKQELAIDWEGNVYVAGRTQSSDFPTKNPIQASNRSTAGRSDAFVTKLNGTGATLAYSTYLGGVGDDFANAISVDSSGNAYVTGSTNSSDFPTTPGVFQTVLKSSVGNAFVTKINAAGSAMVYSTYLGGGATASQLGDFGLGVIADGAGNAYLTGFAASLDFPTQSAIQARAGGMGDAFVTMLNPAGSALLFSTYLGGSGQDIGFGITLDASGSAYVTGLTTSTNFTLVSPLQSSNGGDLDVFIVKITALPPAVFTGGVVNAASFAPGAAVTPGSIASAFGLNLASALAAADRVPLPTALGGASLQLGGRATPLFFVSPAQINLQAPWELAGQTQASITAAVGGVTSGAQTVRLAIFAPGIFTTTQTGSGQGAILIANTASVAAPVGALSGSRPAHRGEFISIYCTGLGPVTNQPATGAKALGNPLSETTMTPGLTVGGIPARVVFSGLAPEFVGLYQVNVEVPANAPAGNAVPVALTIGGASSNTVSIAVQ